MPHIESLPEEILLEITSYLEKRDVLNLRSISRKFDSHLHDRMQKISVEVLEKSERTVTLPYEFEGLSLLAEFSKWPLVAEKLTRIIFQIDPPNRFGMSVCDANYVLMRYCPDVDRRRKLRSTLSQSKLRPHNEFAGYGLDPWAGRLFKECKEYYRKLVKHEEMVAADEDLRMLSVALGNLKKLETIDTKDISLPFRSIDTCGPWAPHGFQHVKYEEIAATGPVHYDHYTLSKVGNLGRLGITVHEDPWPNEYQLLGIPLEKALGSALTRFTSCLCKAIEASGSSAQSVTISAADTSGIGCAPGATALWGIQPFMKATSLTKLSLRFSDGAVFTPPTHWDHVQSGDFLASVICSLPSLEELGLYGTWTGVYPSNILGPTLQGLKLPNLRVLDLRSLTIAKAEDMFHLIDTHRETLEDISLCEMSLITETDPTGWTDSKPTGKGWSSIIRRLQTINIKKFRLLALFELDRLRWHQFRFVEASAEPGNPSAVYEGVISGTGRLAYTIFPLYQEKNHAARVTRAGVRYVFTRVGEDSPINDILQHLLDICRLFPMRYADLDGGDDALSAVILCDKFPRKIKATAEQHFGDAFGKA